MHYYCCLPNVSPQGKANSTSCTNYTILWVIFPRCKFSQMMSFSFNRNFPDLEIQEVYFEKSHMSDIPYKAYMDKTVICHTLTMSIVILVLCLCMVTTCTCICIGVSKNSRFFTVYVYKESSFVWPNFFSTGRLSLAV